MSRRALGRKAAAQAKRGDAASSARASDPAPAPYRLSVLGTFRLEGPAGRVDLANKKLCGLLGYLACAGPGPHSRDRLMSLFWGSHFEAQARQNLRQALSRLRRALGEGLLLSIDEAVGLRPGALSCDVERIRSLIEADTLESLAAAAELYRGEFLADVTIKEEAWVEWLAAERARLEGLAVGALIRLSAIELDRANPDRALATAHRALSIDRLREDAHRLAMRSLAASGRRAEALKHYDRFVALLKQELSVEPDAATRALAAELRRQPAPTAAHQTPAAPPLPDRPSIAVLPFANMSGDPEQEYFADGITEEIITALSKWRWCMVIARNSTFTFKGKSISTKRVGEELGVRYVLEGSVRRAGNRLRITAQLIEAATDAHLWAERYDRDIADVFAVQDEITAHVVMAMDPAIRDSEMERMGRKSPHNVDAWDHFLRGTHHHHLFGKQDAINAITHLQRAIEIEPRFAAAHARLSLSHVSLASLGRTTDVRGALEAAIRSAGTAIALDGLDASAHTALCLALLYTRQYDRAVESGRRAVEVNANYHLAYFALGLARVFAGAPVDALPCFAQAIRLNPRDAASWGLYGQASLGHYMAREYETASRMADKALVERADFAGAKIVKTAALVRLGRVAEAKALLKEVPDIAFAQLPLSCPFRNESDWQHLCGALETAGWQRERMPPRPPRPARVTPAR